MLHLATRSVDAFKLKFKIQYSFKVAEQKKWAVQERNMFLIGKLSAGLGNYPSLKSHNHMAPGVQNDFVLFEVDQKGPKLEK